MYDYIDDEEVTTNARCSECNDSLEAWELSDNGMCIICDAMTS